MENSHKYVLRLAGKVLGATAAISLIVLLLGAFLRWNDPVKFSNGFFAAGAILVILGVLSVTGGFTQRSNFGVMYSESAGQANLAERDQRMAVELRQRYGALIFLVITGLLLISVAVAIGTFL